MKIPALLFLFFSFIQIVNAQHSSQWRGAERNGNYQEKDLLKVWPEDGPELIWYSEDIGSGNSSASVANDRVYITGKKDSLDYISSFNSAGDLLWQKPFGTAWTGSFRETRTTPNVVDGRIFLISGVGEVVCLDEQNGDVLWSIDGYTKFEGIWTLWGISESPLVFDDKIIFTPGGMNTTMVAMDKTSGETIWMSDCLEDSIAYVSPILIEYGGNKIIASISANYFFGINAESGNLLWKFKFSERSHFDHPYAPVINTITPLYQDGSVYITKGYNHEGVKFALNNNGEDIELLWSDTILDVHLGGVVLKDGYIYGANWLNNSNGNWCCIDWENGKTMYETHWISKGSIICADEMLY